jgi:hypothetical protein
MENVAKGLVALAVLSFIAAVLASLMGGALMGFPAESFSRACTNLALVAVAVMLMGGKGQSSAPGV